MPKFPFALIAGLCVLCAFAAPPNVSPTPRAIVPPDGVGTDSKPRVLVFSKTAGFRHDSIPDGIKAITELGVRYAFDVDATEDASQFKPDTLAKYRVVIFLNTTGEILDPSQQAAFEGYIQRGGGFVGIHAATDTEYDWPWYTLLIGAQFASHPKIQEATVNVVDRTHASTKHLHEKWKRTDEWYNFRDHPKNKAGGSLTILALVDESSYEGGDMTPDHPVMWCQEFDGGRSWYTAMGHTKESYTEREFIRSVLGGIRWAGRFDDKTTGQQGELSTDTP